MSEFAVEGEERKRKKAKFKNVLAFALCCCCFWLVVAHLLCFVNTARFETILILTTDFRCLALKLTIFQSYCGLQCVGNGASLMISKCGKVAGSEKKIRIFLKFGGRREHLAGNRHGYKPPKVCTGRFATI